MNCPKGAVLERSDRKLHVLHEISLGHQATDHCAHPGNLKETVHYFFLLILKNDCAKKVFKAPLGHHFLIRKIYKYKYIHLFTSKV